MNADFGDEFLLATDKHGCTCSVEILNKTVILSGTPRRISAMNAENRDPSEYLRMTGGEDFNRAGFTQIRDRESPISNLKFNSSVFICG